MGHSMPNGSKFPAYPILNLLKLLKMLYIMIDQQTKNFNFISSVLFKIWKVQTCHIQYLLGWAKLVQVLSNSQVFFFYSCYLPQNYNYTKFERNSEETQL